MIPVKDVVFECGTCGRTTEEEILPTKHAILGTIPEVNKQATCCRKPDYEDEEGFHSSRESARELIPRLA